MVEMMVRSTSSSSNVHRVIDDNSNPYRNKKVSRSRCCNDASSIKSVHKEILVLVCTQRIICYSRYQGRKNG